MTRLERANVLADGVDVEHTCHLIPEMRPVCPSLYTWFEFDFTGVGFPHAIAASLALDGYPATWPRRRAPGQTKP